MSDPPRQHSARHAAAAAIDVRWVLAVGFGLTAILSVAVATQTYMSMLRHGHSYPRILLWQLASWGFWAVVAPLVLRRGAAFAAGDRRTWRDALPLLALGAVLITIHALVMSQLTFWVQPFVPVARYSVVEAFVEYLPLRLAIDPVCYVLLLIVGGFLLAHHRSRELLVRESRLEAELARAELRALRLEIEPHFLFNTLNAVCALIRLNDNPRALEMLIALSEFMRRNLDQPREPFTSLSAELEWVSRYASLQQLRFGSRLAIEYKVDAGCADIAIPSLLLQPLVENAFRHGASRQARPCRIEIGAARENEHVRLWVADDGAGLPPGFDLERSAGTGLRNTRSRLEQVYGTAATVEVVRCDPAGTRVTVTLPVAAPQWKGRATA